jgi:hypothetical protein
VFYNLSVQITEEVQSSSGVVKKKHWLRIGSGRDLPNKEILLKMDAAPINDWRGEMRLFPVDEKEGT